MPANSRRKSKRIPKLSCHKRTGRAFVRLNGRQHYVGQYGTPAAEEAYRRLVAAWIAHGGALPVESEDKVTVMELCFCYWRYAESLSLSQQTVVKQALRGLKALYGSLPAETFGPNALRAVRQAWVDKGLSRNTVNSYTGIVRHAFKMAASHELIPAATYQALATVQGLRKGRSAARESDPVRAVAQWEIDAVEAFVSPTVWNMIQLQLLCGCRAGELCGLRTTDIDRRGAVWSAIVSEHKTSYSGHDRTLYFGPRAQVLLREILQRRPVGAFLFDPRDAIRERAAGATTHRTDTTPDTPRSTSRKVREQYDTHAYRRAVDRACDRVTAGVKVWRAMAALLGIPDAALLDDAPVVSWTPHQLRHTAATTIRREFGLEAAQLILGHARADVTQLYAQRDQARAIEVALRIG